MADGPWTKYQAAADGPWTKYAQPQEKTVEIPDATKQAQKSVSDIITKRPVRAMQQTMGGPPMFVDVPADEKKQFEEAGMKGYQEGAKSGLITTASTAGGAAVAPLAEGAEAVAGGSKLLKWLLPMLVRAHGAGAGAGAGGLVAGEKPKEALQTAAKVTMGAAGGETVLAGGSAVLSKLTTKVNPLIKINQLLGAGEKEIIPGKTPASLDEFAANPARGALKYGLDEKTLAKMNPMERNVAIQAAKDKAGKGLEQVLQQASQDGKTVNIMPTIEKTFKDIADPKLGKMAEERLTKILQKAGIDKPLSQLTPMEARTVQRGLDEFANFSGQEEAKSFKDIATQLRRGISAETRKAVPASAPFDQDYTDLVNAGKATQKQLKKFASTVPENKLRKLMVKAGLAASGLGGAGYAGYEAAKHWTPVP